MDVLSEEFEVFKSATSRMRWFMISAVLISVLILLHIYLEQFGFQRHQLGTVFASRIKNYTAAKQKCYLALVQYKQRYADQLQSDFPADVCNNQLMPNIELIKMTNSTQDKLLEEYSDLEFTLKRTDNTINNERLAIRQIPLLGIEVPANDFVTVMAIMSLVFVIGVWVNLRGVRASLGAIASRNDPELLRLARLNTVFISSLETESGHSLAKATRSLVFWLPFLSILLATIIGFSPVFSNLVTGSSKHFGPINVVVTHFSIAVLVSLFHLWVAVECKVVLREIDGVLIPKPSVDRP